MKVLECRGFNSSAFTLSPFRVVSSSPIKQPLRFKRVYACATTTAENSKSSDKVETRDTTIISWNVNSLRALIRKDPLALEKLVKQYKPDLLCLQVRDSK